MDYISIMVKDFEIDLNGCLSCMKSAGIFLYPTDTVWGLGADATNESAAQRIMQLKNRPANKSFVILVADQLQLSQYVSHIDDRINLYLSQFTRPTTVIYPGAVGLAPSVIAADGTVAIRICSDPFCQQLLRSAGKPLLSTSANLSGAPTPALFAEIDSTIIQGVDYVVKYRQEDTQRSAPSIIIKWHPEFLEKEQGADVNANCETGENRGNKSPVEIIRA